MATEVAPRFLIAAWFILLSRYQRDDCVTSGVRSDGYPLLPCRLKVPCGSATSLFDTLDGQLALRDPDTTLELVREYCGLTGELFTTAISIEPLLDEYEPLDVHLIVQRDAFG